MLFKEYKSLLSAKPFVVLLLAGILIVPLCDANAEVPVLMYHEISAPDVPGDDTHISLAHFREHMLYLAENGYRTLTLDQLVSLTTDLGIGEKAVVISFDDGWKSQLKVLPILRQYGFKAVFFVFPGEGIADPWGDYMGWRSLREISDDPKFEVQAHSMTHPWARDSNLVSWVTGDTPGKGIADAEYELMESRALLQRRLDTAVRYFAWPAGLYNDRLVKMARDAGYQALFTIVEGAVDAGSDILEIPRIFVNGSCGADGFARMLKENRQIFCSVKH